MRRFGAQLCFVILLVVSVSRAQDHSTAGHSQTPAPRIPRQISQAEAESLEAGVVTNPDNLAAPEALIKYYFQEIVESREPDLQEQHAKQNFCLIEDHPESQPAR